MSKPIEYIVKKGGTMTLDGVQFKIRDLTRIHNGSGLVLFLEEKSPKKPNTKPFKGVFPRSEHRWL